jgi:hypothetical protein
LAVYGCVNTRSGRLRSIGVKPAHCRSGEAQVFWGVDTVK